MDFGLDESVDDIDELPELFRRDAGRKPQDKVFVLFRNTKRVQFKESDLTVQRVKNVFKINSDYLYLEDECRRTLFPMENGKFDTASMRHFGNYSVEGDESTVSSMTMQSNMSTPSPPVSLPGMTPYKTQTWRPTMHQGPSSAFQHPRKRNIPCVRKQIFLAEVDSENAISITGATHVNIVDGKTSVDDVCQSVKETQNMDDDLTLTDVKGYEFTDSESVNCIQFWKSSAKKILCMKSSDFLEISLHRERARNVGSKRKRSAKVSPVGFNTEPVEDAIEDLRKEICPKLSVIGDQMNDYMTVQNNVNANISDVKAQVSRLASKLVHVEELTDKLNDVSEENNIAVCLRQMLVCKICTKLPSKSVAICSCCQQFVGCGTCMQEWVLHKDSCILCKQEGISSRVIIMNGFDVLLRLLNAKDE